MSVNSVYAGAVVAARPGEVTAASWLLGFTLVLAPLFRSGMPALAVLTLEVLGVVLLALVLWRPRPGLLGRAEAIALVLLVAVPLLYLVPLPAPLAQLLPGREAYLAAQTLASAGRTKTLSLYPLETESALLFMLVPIGVFVATRMLDERHMLRLMHVLLWLAAAQALLGLLQYVASPGSPQLLGLDLPDVQSAVGTYTNRNHLAGLLEMLLPVALALMTFWIGRRDSEARTGWRAKIAFLGSLRGHVALAYAAVAVLLLVGLIFTRSRGGIALGVVGVLVSTALFARRLGGGNVYGATGTVVASAVGIGIAIGLAQVLDRFSVGGAIQDGRWTIFSSTLEGVGVFAPLGSGPGNYPDVFVAFQPLELGEWFINHAHNDYLEWLFEGGIIAAALIVLLLVLFIRQWVRLLTPATWSLFRFVQVGAGIGVTLLALHSLVDFNLHIPANVVYFAFLSGVFFSNPATADQPARRPRRRTSDLHDEPKAVSPPAPRQGPKIPPDQIPNPFLDE